MARHSVQVIGHIWQPGIGPCAMQYTLGTYDLENIGEWNRDNVELWLMLNSGDFREILDFAASGPDGEIPWSDEESEFTYIDCMHPSAEPCACGADDCWEDDGRGNVLCRGCQACPDCGVIDAYGFHETGCAQLNTAKCAGCNDPISCESAFHLSPLDECFCESCYMDARLVYDESGQFIMPHPFKEQDDSKPSLDNWCAWCNTARDEIIGMHA